MPSVISPSAVFREATTEFTVDASPLTRRGGDHVKAEVRNPSGGLTDYLVTDKADGTYTVEYTPFENGNTPEPACFNQSQLDNTDHEVVTLFCCPFLWLVRISGVHSVHVLYDDTPVPKSPFRVSVVEGCDPSRVVATGPGLQGALTDKPNNFNIITR